MRIRLLLIVLANVLSMGEPAHAGQLAGYKLLLTSIRTGDTEVFIVAPDTGDAFNVSRSPQSEDRYPCWSPDGKRIAFTSDRNNSTNLYVVNADGNRVKRIVTSPAVCYMPSWQKTPKGERIVFGMHGERPEMASVRPDGSDLRMLGVGHDPCLSPDGKVIAYTGEVLGGVTVFVMDYEGGNKRQLVKGASKPGAVFPNWSPDGRQIVYSWPVGDALELFVIDIDGGRNHQLTFGLTADLWQGHVEKEVGQNYGKLLQLYGVHKATIEARKKGLSVLRRQQQNGSIKLVLMGVGV